MIYSANSVHSAELGAPVIEGFRRPVGPPIGELVRPGSVVETSYRSGPYCVVKISGPHFVQYIGPDHPMWSLCMIDANWRDRRKNPGPADSWINEVVPVDGRLLKLFENNRDEVFVTGFDEDTARLVLPKPKQLELF